MKWLYDNDKLALTVGVWIFRVNATLHFYPFFWRIFLARYPPYGFSIAFGPFILEVDY